MQTTACRRTHTQIKLSDGVNPFDANALAEGVTVQKLDYDEMAVDAGFKYRGFSFQSEYYCAPPVQLPDRRRPSPAQCRSSTTGSRCRRCTWWCRRLVGLYGTYGKVFDEFDRNPYEISGGANYYPSGTRSLRLNMHLIRVLRSPAASNFGFYTSGQNGTTLSLGIDILL